MMNLLVYLIIIIPYTLIRHLPYKAVKGLAFANNLPCAPISTLAGMASRFAGIPYTGLILTAMDARCQQIYTALFSCENGVVTRITPDEA